MTLPQQGFAGWVCAVKGSYWVEQSQDSRVALSCRRLLKALTHFQVSSSPPHAHPNTLHTEAALPQSARAAVELHMQMLGTSGCACLSDKSIRMCRAACAERSDVCVCADLRRRCILCQCQRELLHLLNVWMSFFSCYFTSQTRVPSSLKKGRHICTASGHI